MKEINVEDITGAVAQLAIEATHFLPEDVEGAIRSAKTTEQSPIGIQIIDEILENAEIARTKMLPLCQDTGTAVVHVEIGQNVHITGGYLLDAINAGVEKGYDDGYLRKSIVSQPLSKRTNTKTNTPAVIHTDIVTGENLKIMFIVLYFINTKLYLNGNKLSNMPSDIGNLTHIELLELGSGLGSHAFVLRSYAAAEG